jgi:uncharacterized radical SAM protein YgiQ
VRNNPAFLPTSAKEIAARGWDRPDVILLTGDAYVDHPAFGAAVIGRVLEHAGWRVAIVPQPNWRDDLRDFRKLGAPRLFFGVTAGSMDSMVNHYTANRRLRSDDAYTAGGKAGMRPDYAVKTYSRILKKLFPETPLVLGGIEASLRRFSHYDYWADSVLPPILAETGADLLAYGMGERAVLEIARRIDAGEPLEGIAQTARRAPLDNLPPLRAARPDLLLLHPHETAAADKRAFAENFRVIEEQSNRLDAAPLAQAVGGNFVLAEPPGPPPGTEETDAVFALPYTRRPHPRYEGKHIPAFAMIRDSVTLHRGCFGGCSFCTISAHQGKFVSSRSEASILAEVARVASAPDFSGHITDLGGPSANMWGLRGRSEKICALCRRPSCLFPKICPNLNTDHAPLTALYAKAEAVKGVRKVTIGSGLRYDLFLDENGFLNDAARAYFRRLVARHVSGRLKVAPEHSEPHVLDHVRKPRFELFERLKEIFDALNAEDGARRQLVPYFISSLPTCRDEDMRRLRAKLRRLGCPHEQVQDFTPTPLTLDSTLYHTGLDPWTLKPVFVAKTREEKLCQRAELLPEGAFSGARKPRPPKIQTRKIRFPSRPAPL